MRKIVVECVVFDEDPHEYVEDLANRHGVLFSTALQFLLYGCLAGGVYSVEADRFVFGGLVKPLSFLEWLQIDVDIRR